MIDIQSIPALASAHWYVSIPVTAMLFGLVLVAAHYLADAFR